MNKTDDEQLVRVVLNAPVGICIMDAATLVSEIVNDSFIEVAGKPYEAIAGHYYWDTFAEAAPYYEASLATVVREGRPFFANEVELMLVRHGKEEHVFVTFVYVPIKDEKGTVKKVAVWVLENTIQVKARQLIEAAKNKSEASEKALRSMILQAPVAMCILLGHLYVIDVANDYMIELWGKVATDVLNKPLFDAIPDVREQGFEQLLADVFISGKTIKENEREVSLLRKGKQETVFLNFVYEPYRDASGNIQGVLAIAVEVTEQVLTRQKVEQTATQLQQTKSQLETELEAGKLLQRQKDDFIGMVSHELKTPLTSLSAIIQVADSRLKNDEDKFLAGAMSRANLQVKRMAAMINGFLNVSRLESGKLIIDKQTFLIDELIKENVNEISIVTPNRPIIFSECRPVSVLADHDKIESVVSNLLNNAIKYSAKETPIHVTCEAKDEYVLVSIRDEGMGISNDDLEKIFDRYYRAQSTPNNHIAGFGIGLYLSRQIILQHGGEIFAESEVDKGSTFRFTLPLKV